jgi:hypothetical protein
MEPRTSIIKSYFLGIVFSLSLYCADDKRFIFCIISFICGLLSETWINISLLRQQQYKQYKKGIIIQKILLISFLFFTGFLSGFLFVNGTFIFLNSQLLLFLKYSLMFLLLFFFLYDNVVEYSNKHYNLLHKTVRRITLVLIFIFIFISFFLFSDNDPIKQIENLFLIYVEIVQKMFQAFSIMYSFLSAVSLSKLLESAWVCPRPVLSPSSSLGR